MIKIEKAVLLKRTKNTLPRVETKIPIKIIKAQKKDVKLVEKIGFGNKIKNKKRFEKYLDTGAKCFIALYKNEPVHISWITNRNQEINMRLKGILKTKDVVLSNAYTKPKYRKNKIHQKLIEKRLSYIANKKRVYVMVMKHNKASITNLKKFGFKVENKYIHITLFSIKFFI